MMEILTVIYIFPLSCSRHKTAGSLTAGEGTLRSLLRSRTDGALIQTTCMDFIGFKKISSPSRGRMKVGVNVLFLFFSP
jgi:hypothetical protein